MAGVIETVKETITGVSESEKDKDHKAIIQGLIHKRVVWHKDSLLKNWWFFLCQKHVLLGIACCHLHHPYNRLERGFVWFSCVLGAAGCSLLLSDASFGSELSASQVAVFEVVIGCYLSIKAVFMRSLVTCSCLQDGSTLQVAASVVGSDDAAKKKCEGLGCRVAALSLVTSLILIAVGIALCAGKSFNWTHFLQEFFISQIYSWVMELASITMRFLFGWYGFLPCISGAEGSASDKVKREKMSDKYPEGPEYPKDKNEMWGKDRSQCKGCFDEAPDTVDGNEEGPQGDAEDLPAEAKV